MTRTRHAILRADATPEIGTGHVVRCLTLGTELRRRGWVVRLASRALPAGLAASAETEGIGLLPLPGDRPLLADTAELASLATGSPVLVVVDHYGIGADWHRAARAWAENVMAIDDLADRMQAVDLLLNQNLGASSARYAGLVPETTRVLAGPRYALVRPEFPEARTRSHVRDGSIRRILIFMSGSDPDDATRQALTAAAVLEVPVDVVVGGGYRHLAELREQAAGRSCTIHVETRDMAGLMARADLAIGAPGSASWERCTLGLPTVLVELADNQTEVGRLLAERGAAIDLGPFATVDAADMEGALLELRDDPARLAGMSVAAAGITDGHGTDRVADEIERLFAGADR